jgi:formylglycine-generating enzyme required for sulfatase activity
MDTEKTVVIEVFANRKGVTAFEISKTLVTQGEYRALMGENPSRWKTLPDAENCPVDSLTLEEVRAYCDRLSVADGLVPFYSAGGQHGWRIPTITEWLAARGEVPKNLGEYAWYSDNSDARSHLVATKKPNAYGLYDMLGNMWEDISGAGAGRSTCGGGFSSGPAVVSDPYAYWQGPRYRDDLVSFRPARSLPLPEVE